jgi:hypothetical protein
MTSLITRVCEAWHNRDLLKELYLTILEVDKELPERVSVSRTLCTLCTRRFPGLADTSARDIRMLANGHARFIATVLRHIEQCIVDGDDTVCVDGCAQSRKLFFQSRVRVYFVSRH